MNSICGYEKCDCCGLVRILSHIQITDAGFVCKSCENPTTKPKAPHLEFVDGLPVVVW